MNFYTIPQIEEIVLQKLEAEQELFKEEIHHNELIHKIYLTLSEEHQGNTKDLIIPDNIKQEMKKKKKYTIPKELKSKKEEIKKRLLNTKISETSKDEFISKRNVLDYDVHKNNPEAFITKDLKVRTLKKKEDHILYIKEKLENMKFKVRDENFDTILLTISKWISNYIGTYESFKYGIMNEKHITLPPIDPETHKVLFINGANDEIED